MFFFVADRKSEPLLRPDAKDHSKVDKKNDNLNAIESKSVDGFLHPSTAIIGSGVQQLSHNILIIFLLVLWVFEIV